jgi:hypothetical protein
MATTRNTAKRLCTAAEYELVESSFPPAVNQLDRKAINRHIARVRRLRAKFRDQADAMAREMQGKAPPRGRRPAQGNRLTVAKAKLFDETLARLEKRAERLEAMEQRKSQAELARQALASKREAGSSGRPASRTAGGGMQAKPARGRKKGTFPAEGTRKGQLSAAIKRGQARRDSRG